MKFDQDLCLNLQYDFGKMNSTLGSVVPLAMFRLMFVPEMIVTTTDFVKPTLSSMLSEVTIFYITYYTYNF